MDAYKLTDTADGKGEKEPCLRPDQLEEMEDGREAEQDDGNDCCWKRGIIVVKFEFIMRLVIGHNQCRTRRGTRK